MNETTIKYLLKELMELEIVYGYMVQNAPTEESRRISALNMRTVQNTKEMLLSQYENMCNVPMPPLGETIENVPVFTDFMQAVRYAILEETQVISALKNLYGCVDQCYQNLIFGPIIEHINNAIRLVYLDLF